MSILIKNISSLYRSVLAYLSILLLSTVAFSNSFAATEVLNSSGGQCAFDGASGGLSVHVGGNSQFQVERCSADGLTSKSRQYYNTSVLPPSTSLFNSTFLKIGTTVYGANANWASATPFTEISSSSTGGLIGDGQAVTVYSAVKGPLTYTITQTVDYIFPNDFYRVKMVVDVPVGNTEEVKLFSWTDIMLDGDDNGTCSRQSTFPEYVIADNSAATIYSGYRQNSAVNHWDRYECGFYSNMPNISVASASGDLLNTLDATNHDVGAAVQWDIGIVSGSSYTADYDFVFSINQPSLTKRYGPDDGDVNHSMNVGDTTQLTFLVDNRPGTPAQGSINFTETLPANVTIAAVPTVSQCGGTISTGNTGGRDTITLTGGQLLGGVQQCSIVVDVTSSTAGVYDDPASNITATNNLKNLAQAELTVLAAASAEDYSDGPVDGGVSPNGISTTAYGEAKHVVVSGIQLGSTIDTDASSIFSNNASADGADDDGLVTLPTLTEAAAYTLQVAVTGTGTLSGWIDYDGDGTFDADDTVTGNIGIASTGGTIDLPIHIPEGVAGTTFLRLRYSSDAAALAANGSATDGEVEDYQITILPKIVNPTNPGTTPTTSGVCTAYNATGSDQLITVPAAASGLTIKMWGAGGGHELVGTGYSGAGGYSEAEFNSSVITPGDVLSLVVGQGGNSITRPDEFSPASVYGFGSVSGHDQGGGLTGLFTGNTTVAETDQARALIIAGGGAGYEHSGDAAAGTNGGNGHSATAGGQPTMRGSTDVSPYYNGLTSTAHRGAGGGGYYGGGRTAATSNYSTTFGNLQPDSAAATGGSGFVSPSAVAGRLLSTADGNNTPPNTADSNYVAGIGEGSSSTTARAGGNGLAVLCWHLNDYSDAPADGSAAPSGGTTSYGIAAHSAKSTNINMGGFVDSELAALTSANAEGDGSDDNGVIMPNIPRDSSKVIPITIRQASANQAYLQAWIDFDGNGDFNGIGEQVASDVQYADGTNGIIYLTVNIPATATLNQTFARFRWSTDPGLNSTEQASDGEVEDYALTIKPATTSTYHPTNPTFTSNLPPNAFCQVEDFSSVSSVNLSTDPINPDVFRGFSVHAFGTGMSWGASKFSTNLATDINWNASAPNLPGIYGSFGTSGLAGSESGVQFDMEPGVVALSFEFVDWNDTHERSFLKVTYSNGTVEDIYGNVNPTGAPAQFFGFTVPVGQSIESIQWIDHETYSEVVGFWNVQTCKVADFGDAPAVYGSAGHSIINMDYYLGATMPDPDATMAGSLDADADDNDALGDDEDGVTLPVLVQGATTTIPVVVNQAAADEGYLQAWIDWNGNDNFTDAGEQIAVNLQLSTGATGTINVPITVPDTTTVAKTYLRFRWSTMADLNSMDVAADGEVEDYAITIRGADKGDAPATMASIDAALVTTYGEASHGIVSGLQLGLLIDDDNTSQGTGLNADGDDLDGTDDDDGVSFPLSGAMSVLRVDQANTITVSASNVGFLNAWIDWNQDGDWNDVGEQIANNVAMIAGNNSLSVTPDLISPHGKTYARFRFTSSSVTSPSPLGLLEDGEVEDHIVNLVLEMPANVCTPVLVNSGFESAPTPGLGSHVIRDEATIVGWGTIANSATSGLNYNQRNDIEIWGSGFNTVPAFSGNYFAEINAYVDGMLYQDAELIPGETVGWSFAHRARVGTDVIRVMMGPPGAEVSQGEFSTDTSGWQVYSGQYTVAPGETVTRIGFQAVSTGSNDISVGNFIDNVLISGGCDFGDAPDTYGTTFASNGAFHTSDSQVFMGPVFGDSEVDATDNAAADGDNTDATIDDEDAISGLSALAVTDNGYSVDVTVTNQSLSPAILGGWIDFDRSGTFEADEAARLVIPAGTTNRIVTLDWSAIPADIQAGSSYLRLRLTTDALSVADSIGRKTDGEVEDHPITIVSSVGSSVSGQVFIDVNTNAANDAEAGLGGVTIVLRDTLFGSCVSTQTDALGNYLFTEVMDGGYELYQADGETVPQPQNCGTTFAKNPAGYTSTTPDTLGFLVAGIDVANQDFGEVGGTNGPGGNTGSGLRFEPDHTGNIMPNNTVFYAHTFNTTADGQVRFVSPAGSGNSTAGWAHAIYRDANCDGELSNVEANTAIDGINFGINAGSQICIINKVYAPANVPAQDQYNVTTTATFTYAGGVVAPATLEVIDKTVSGQSITPTNPGGEESRLELTKTVENVTQLTGETDSLNQASPGDFLKYRIYYRNTGSGPITDLQVNDTVPPYTSFVAASDICDVTPASLSCTPVRTFDDLRWDFTGALLGGESGHVSYEVTVDN